MNHTLSIRRALKRAREENECMARARYAEQKAKAAQSHADRRAWTAIVREWRDAARQCGLANLAEPAETALEARALGRPARTAAE